LYVARAHQGRGIGTVLLEQILERARRQGYHNLIGGIDAENTASIALHERFGFVRCGLIRHAGFKFGRWLDLAFYQKLLDTPAEPVDG
jgi:L-amino acid N-acyltransferase YncA